MLQCNKWCGAPFFTGLHERRVEMEKSTLDTMNDVGKRAYEAAKELGEINARSTEKMLQKQLDALNLYMQTGVQQMQLLMEAKGYQDVLAGQARISSEYTEKLLDNTRAMMEIATKARDELSGWAEKSMAAATESMSKTAP
jgi:phasin family protein